MTTDSWELPSYLAGDLIPMSGRPGVAREKIPGDSAIPDDWEAPVIPIRPAPVEPERPSPPPDPYFESYDPSTYHEPAELYNQKHIEGLEGAGFHPAEAGVWQRHIRDKNDHVIATHTITYVPGSRLDNNSLRPWHTSTDPDEVGEVHPTLRSAIKHLDDHAASLNTPVRDQFKLSVREQTPAQIAAQKWLDDQDHEEWMRAREGDPDEGYSHWDHTQTQAVPGESYSDFLDPAGQTFHEGEEEARSHVMPGSAYNWEETPQGGEPAASWQRHEYDDDEGVTDQDRYEELLGEHNFNWEPKDPTAGQPGNPLSPETPGKWVNQQLDSNGRHFATHTLTNDEGHRPGQWTLHTELGEHGHPVTFPTSIHGEGDIGLEGALDKHKKNSMEAMLPAHGYEPVFAPGRPGHAPRHWTRTDPAPRSHSNEPLEPYTHEISVGNNNDFFGQSFMHPTNNSYASSGSRAQSSNDLADLVREHSNISSGLHPGGSQDHRLTKDELLSHPSVASALGQPARISDNFYNDNKVGSASWRIPHPEGSHLPHVNAEATYNWPKGGYDFKYTHDGTWLAATHNAVPAGAPTHVPGRQTSLDLESAR